MNIFQLSLKAVWRKRARSILLFFIVLAAAIFVYAGWACGSSSIKIQDESRQAEGASFRLEANEKYRQKQTFACSNEIDKRIGENKEGEFGGYHRQQLKDGSWMCWTDNSFETLRLEDITKISKAAGVKAFNVTTANTVANPVGFKRIEDSDVNQSSDEKGVSLRGNRDMRYDFDVQKGNIVVKEGRMVQKDDENVCVVSRELADINSLSLGTVLKFNNCTTLQHLD